MPKYRPPRPERIVVGVVITPEIRAWLEGQAWQRDKGMSTIIRELIVREMASNGVAVGDHDTTQAPRSNRHAGTPAALKPPPRSKALRKFSSKRNLRVRA
jgi:hypothetical protein